MKCCKNCSFFRKAKLKFDKKTGKPYYKESEFGENSVCFKFSPTGDKIPEGTEESENDCSEFYVEKNEDRIQA